MAPSISLSSIAISFCNVAFRLLCFKAHVSPAIAYATRLKAISRGPNSAEYFHCGRVDELTSLVESTAAMATDLILLDSTEYIYVLQCRRFRITSVAACYRMYDSPAHLLHSKRLKKKLSSEAALIPFLFRSQSIWLQYP